jgi:protein-S-isoprenylcysteine O-methyltransferase Ste14
MQFLELKIPPPLVAAVIAAAMWGGSLVVPLVAAPAAWRVAVALVFALAGGAVALAGVVAFRRASTTVNPMKPERTSALVSSGVFRLTRNPMYVGLLLVLIAVAAFLSSAWLLLGPAAFVLYINRFQIEPEERVLSQAFGATYASYRSEVRRWL